MASSKPDLCEWRVHISRDCHCVSRKNGHIKIEKGCDACGGKGELKKRVTLRELAMMQKTVRKA